jgi:hypothetical protein
MSWFRNWVGRKARAVAPRAPSFRPRLEPLEERRVMNVSSAIDVRGNVMQLAVDNTFKLTQTFMGVSQVIGQDVLRAHAYRDSNGGIGFIIIYGADTGFQAVDFDHTGGHFLGFGIQDADKAYDRAGHLQLDITYSSNGQFTTIEFTDLGAHQVNYAPGIIEELVHPYVDAQGKLARTISYFSTQSDCVTVAYDSSGGHFLATNAVADYAYNVQGTTFVLDIVYIGGSAFEYTPTTATHLGDNFRI